MKWRTGSYVFWLFGDKPLNRSEITKAVSDMKSHGFIGVIIQQRMTVKVGQNYKYGLDDKRSISTHKIMVEKCRNQGLKVWLHLDLRGAARTFARKYKDDCLQVLYFCIGNIRQGKFKLGIEYQNPLFDHLTCANTQEVKVEKCFGFNQIEQKEDGLLADDILDLTDKAKLRREKDINKVCIYGKGIDRDKVIIFIKVTYDTFSYTSNKTFPFLRRILEQYKKEIPKIDGIWSDEPGHPPAWQWIQVANEFYRMFKAKFGYELRDKLYALILHSKDSSFNVVRYQYHELLAEVMSRHQKRWKEYAINLWGEGLKVGIHQTNQEIMSVDARRGTLDNFQLLDTVTAGYTDICGMEQTEVMALFLMVYAKSLAKLSRDKIGYVNVWDYRRPNESVEFTSMLLGLFGCKWLDHAYGNTQGSGPGWPDHASWKSQGKICLWMREIEKITQNRPVDGEVLVIYNVETAYWLGEGKADLLRPSTAQVVVALEKKCYPVDLISTRELERVYVEAGRIILDGRTYGCLIYPYPLCMREEVFKKIKNLYMAGGRILLYGTPLIWSPKGKNQSANFKSLFNLRAFHLEAPYRLSIETFPAYISWHSEIKKPISFSGTFSLEHMTYGVEKDWAGWVGNERIRLTYTNQEYWALEGGENIADIDESWEKNTVGVVKKNKQGGIIIFIGLDIGAIDRTDLFMEATMNYFKISKIANVPQDIYISKATTSDGFVLSLTSSNIKGRVTGLIEIEGVKIDTDCRFLTVRFKKGIVKDYYAIDCRKLKIDEKIQ